MYPCFGAISCNAVLIKFKLKWLDTKKIATMQNGDTK